MVDDNKRLLLELSQAAHTGINALQAVMPEVKNGRMRRQLNHQLLQYQSFAGETGYSQKGHMADGISKFSAKMQAKMNPTPSHIASMMMQGSEMGIIKMQKAYNRCPLARQETKRLAKDMMQFAQNTIDAYRPFL